MGLPAETVRETVPQPKRLEHSIRSFTVSESHFTDVLALAANIPCVIVLAYVQGLLNVCEQERLAVSRVNG